MNLSIPFIPKKPGPFRVLTIGRISTEHQDITNLEAMYDLVEDRLKQAGLKDFTLDPLGERAKGMLVDRPTFLEAMRRIESGEYDLVAAEDISRVHRNSAYINLFVQLCVDTGTRCICFNDGLDTADDTWESVLQLATARHGLHIPDTRKRVRRTATHAFRQGGMVLHAHFGYRKLTAEQTDSGEFGPRGLRIAKVSECTPILEDMRQRVLRGESYASIADALNASGISPGANVKRGHWTGKLVKELLGREILHGERVFRKILYKLEYRSGRSRPERNDPDKVERCHYPELAHFTPEQHEELLKAMDQRASEYGRNANRRSPRHRVPRCRTIFPRQHAICGICEAPMYPIEKGRLVCSKSRVGECWNKVRPSEAIVRKRCIGAILNLA